MDHCSATTSYYTPTHPPTQPTKAGINTDLHSIDSKETQVVKEEPCCFKLLLNPGRREGGREGQIHRSKGHL
jgi:hypothetical protein